MSATDTFLTTARNAGAGDLGGRHDQHPVPEGSGEPDLDQRPAVKLYRNIMSRYYPNGANPAVQANGINYYGVALAHAYVQLCGRLAPNPTREGSSRPRVAGTR